MELLTVIYCTLKYFQFYNFIFVQFMSMVCAGKKDLSNVRLLESKEKLGGNPAIVRDDQATTILKGLNTGQYMAFSFQIKVQFALKNAWLPPIFFFFFLGFQHLFSISAFSCVIITCCAERMSIAKGGTILENACWML